LRKCPYCAEQIEDDATICPFCRSPLTQRPEPSREPSAWAYGPGGSTPAPSETPRPARVRAWAFFAGAVAVVTVLGLVVYLASRSSDDPVVAPSTDVAASLEPGWTLVTEADDDFSIGLPRGWEESQFDVGESIKFQAIDRSDQAANLEFAPNLNVIAEPLPFALSLDDYIQANLSQLETQLQGLTNLVHQRVTLPVGPTERIEYRFDLGTEEGEAFDVSVVQYVFILNTTGYILTFETAPPQFDQYRQTFEQMARTFRFTG
jgi:hypothetical protein